MADDQTSKRVTHAAMAHDDVRQLASKAIRELVERVDARSGPLSKRLERLSEMYLSEDPQMRHRALELLRAEGVSSADTVDHILPEVARRLGQQWADDTLSFAEVTIGTARLQESVRALSTRGTSAAEGRGIAAEDRKRVLLIVPRTETHTFGAVVAADQLRRLGLEVDVAMDTSRAELCAMLRDRRYDLAGISVAGRRTLASARELVETIRANVTRVTPIYVGGSLVGSEIDIKGLTGADFVTNDIQTALEMCGLDEAGLDPPLTTARTLAD